MNRMIFVGVLLALVAPPTAFTQARPEQDVLAAEDAFTLARQRGDKAAYERLLGKRFTRTTTAGRVVTREEELARFGSSSPQRAIETGNVAQSVTDFKVQMYGDTAVVSSIAHLMTRRDRVLVPHCFLEMRLGAAALDEAHVSNRPGAL